MVTKVTVVTETQPENPPQQLLQNWIGDPPYQLLLLEKARVGDGFPLDYSLKSLERSGSTRTGALRLRPAP
ncbi:hypothetical protein [Streptomyces natalensis]|uniref:Uncharacterized protein n=1 Tax=Streptomyces natalensis ATCC 27448 TaxID=1240678 RepID=A0A0D7CKQ4_9ACTN|nr:hypothetical protein [Streptomyces natalensis]KIZ16435.1 hypothetical protein SNA_20625 [Streptomyces natalensis ATCC 27448]